MDRAHLNRLTRNPRYVSSIYNYCDRWCERCTRTSLCMLFAMEKGEDGASDDWDRRNAEFWTRLTIGGQAFSLMSDIPDDEDSGYRQHLESTLPEPYESLAVAAEHPCARLSDVYSAEVDELSRQLGRAVRDHESNGLHDNSEILAPDQLFPVVLWYQHQIHAKLMRALLGLGEDGQGSDYAGQRDCDGSAKVALIGIERSMAAWSLLFPHFPARKGAILYVYAILAELHQVTLRTFPSARSFVRPGFDAE